MVSGVIFGWRKEMTMWPGRQGPRVGEGVRIGCTGSGLGIAGPQTPFSVGPKGLPRPLFYFSFSFLLFFFCFLISFIDFANLVQIDSNQFVKFPRIQHSNLEL
jgi:hypothetical protein